ncbi:hypothetical protein [Limobrevibacterium gyesilva]|uniref:Calcium-binding protein n=1 Tax=Limobrevibacterium gyesilva TaxID=2991712 RepID=A0AA41YL90_9PROT|nr:hypothetical protein [Limobrevibacterium gyesilva]MCW3474461.1 hypothetical protein [Limobrevibacterium gyesilva]
MSDPITALHYTPNANFVGNTYAPGAVGFNLADVSSVSGLNSLPAGVQGLVYLGMTNGADATFQSAVQQYIGNPKLFGFYLADEPGPTVSAANLKAESDWIHANVPGAKTFIVLENNGTSTKPSFSFNPGNTGIDLYGVDPYPIQPQFSGGADFSIIANAVNAAEASGIAQSQIVPVYQAFGGGGYASWTLPTAAQEQQILSTWGTLVPTPAFDYAYSWGTQNGDTAIVNDPALQQVFAAHNALASSTPTPTPTPTPAPTPTPVPPASDSTLTATDKYGVTANVPVITSGSQDFKGPLAGTVHQAVASGVDTISATSAITSETLLLGSGTQAMSFIGRQSLAVTGGSGTDTVKAAAGRNTFTAGTGTLDVTGGSGKDTYVFHAGDGLLRIEDFSLLKGDRLLVDQALKGSLQQAPDGHGGVMLTFGSAGHGIDLPHLSSFNASNIHFV